MSTTAQVSASSQQQLPAPRYRKELLDRIVSDQIEWTEEDGKLVKCHFTSSDVGDFHNHKQDIDAAKHVAALDLHQARMQAANASPSLTPARDPRIHTAEEINALLAKHVDSKQGLLLDIGASEVQRRNANTYEKFDGYVPVNIGTDCVRRYAKKYNRMALVANAEALPFPDASVDGVVTHAFLEHPGNPDAVLREIARVLKPGGIAVHNDAWHCRWWQRFGLIGLKSFSKMTARERAIFMAAKLTESPAIRFPRITARRLMRELCSSTSRPIPLKRKQLRPNFSLNLGADEHAVSSIDPMDVRRFYASRGFHETPRLRLPERIFFRAAYIAVIKDDS